MNLRFGMVSVGVGVLLSAISGATIASAQSWNEPVYDEVDGVALALALARDQKIEAAEKVLAELSPSERRQFTGEIAFVRGVILLRQSEPVSARARFQDALRNSSTLTSSLEQIQLEIAEADRRAGNFEGCAVSYSIAGWKAIRTVDLALLRARCEREARQFQQAWKTLLWAQARFGAALPLVRERVDLLMAQGMPEEARRIAMGWLQKQTESASWITVSEVFTARGQNAVALEILELGRLRVSREPEIHLAALSHYHRAGLPRAVIEAFERASQKRAEYFYHVAELRRERGERILPNWWNTRAREGASRLRQRVALAVEQGKWSEIAALAPAVSREKLDGDDEVNYALGFSLWRLGNREHAERFFAKVREPRLLAKIGALMRS